LPRQEARDLIWLTSPSTMADSPVAVAAPNVLNKLSVYKSRSALIMREAYQGQSGCWYTLNQRQQQFLSVG
jgi:hypothetical protein